MSGRRARLRSRPRAPEEGWSSLLLLLGMLLLLGISVADARPLVPDSEGGHLSDRLPVIMLAAGLIGFVLARSRLGVVRAHALGAGAAAGVLLMVAGAALLGDAQPMPVSTAELVERVEAVWQRLDTDVDAILAEDFSTAPLAVFLILGAICWTTAQFSAFSVFRYDRGGPAVVAIGTVFFLNIGLDSLAPSGETLPALPVLALFSALAMLLLMRLQLVQQRFQWARRHISDTGEVSRLFLRSGLVFVVIAVISASSLTAWATVEAQEVDLGDLERPMEDLGEELARLLGLFGVPMPDAPLEPRDATWAVQSKWDVDQRRGTAFTASLEGPPRGNYWWGWADDRFDGWAWSSTGAAEQDVPAGASLPVTERDSTGGPYRAVATITVDDADFVRSMAFRLAEAAVIDRAVTVSLVDDGRGISDILYAEPLDQGDRVVIESYIRDYRKNGESPTANELRAAQDVYPPWVEERYLQVEPGTNGPLVVALAREIREATGNAYDAAEQLQDHLGGMEYVTDMGKICAAYPSIPECVLAEEKGFCQHYSTTMAMVLREMGIPSRAVTGYLPGTLADDVWTVPRKAFHNWTEVYFPDFGWIRFDPTPAERGLGQAATEFDDGPPIPTATDRPPTPTEPPLRREPSPEPSMSPIGAGDTGIGGDGDRTLAIVVSTGALLALLLTVVSGLLLFRLRRLPEGDDGLAYRGIVSLASRLGYGPHPAQTEYEYAGALSETIPSVRDELFVVAEARVQAAYGQRRIDREGRSALRRAYARIRTALLRLSLRRKR